MSLISIKNVCRSSFFDFCSVSRSYHFFVYRVRYSFSFNCPKTFNFFHAIKKVVSRPLLLYSSLKSVFDSQFGRIKLKLKVKMFFSIYHRLDQNASISLSLANYQPEGRLKTIMAYVIQ